MSRRDILVIAATSRELAPPVGWRVHKCGVGPVDAAVSTAAAIALDPPRAIVHVGIAGARRDQALAPAAVVVGVESVYCDVDPDNRWVSHVLLPDAELLNAITRALPEAAQLRIGTSARIGGTQAGVGAAPSCPVEAMEGFSVLRAAQLAAVPAIEVRVISNEIEEQDRARWHFDAAFAALARVTETLVDAAVNSRQTVEP